MAKKHVLKRAVRKTTAKSSRRKKRASRYAATFLADAHPAVKSIMADTVTLPDFRETPGGMSRADRLRLIEQALLLIEQNYVHLPLKEAMHAVRPIQALKVLRRRVEISENDELTDLAFHREMIRIFVSVRDLHTNYILPSPYSEMTAFVPFLIEEYVEAGKRRYLVSHVFDGFDQPPFAEGVDLTSWNGAPIDLAVEANAERFAGSNEDARHARGVERMTIRPLITSLPPDEDFVQVGYRTDDGAMHELRANWLVFSPEPGGGGTGSGFSARATALGIDADMEMAGRAKKTLFAPKVVAAETAIASGKTIKKARSGADVPSLMPDVLAARTVDTPSGEFGYIRIHTFSVDGADAFVAEVIRLIEQLPGDGLIIDVRSNGGGLILAGEQLLQLFTPREIEPERTQFINTMLNLEIVRLHAPSPFSGFSLASWRDSMEESILTGAAFSRGFPITDPDDANAIGQRYSGPVVLITDAKCYSTTDIFAAGFQDHEIGPILGVDGNTGAGGANVWEHNLLAQLADAGTDSPYEDLPGGANMRVAIRRTLRTGARAGTPLEDLGVKPDHRHELTRNDLLNGNEDLINRAAELLAAGTVRRLDATVDSNTGGVLMLKVDVSGIDRVDVYLDDRPLGSIDVSPGENEIEVPDADDVDVATLQGFDDGDLVSSRRIEL